MQLVEEAVQAGKIQAVDVHVVAELRWQTHEGELTLEETQLVAGDSTAGQEEFFRGAVGLL
jgi:hypothetical protein